MSNPVTRWFNRTSMKVLARAYGISPNQMVGQALAQAFVRRMGELHPVTNEQIGANRGWVFAANRQIAGRACAPDAVMEMVSRSRNGDPVKVPVTSHPFLDLLDQPNHDETGKAFRYRQVLHLNTAGRAYVAVWPERIDLSSLGGGLVYSRIGRLELLEPERVRVDRMGGRATARFVYNDIDGGVIDFPPAPATRAERDRWRADPTPFVIRMVLPAADSWNGQAPAEAGAAAIDTLKSLTNLWSNELRNGLHAGLLFYLKNGDMEDATRFEKAVAIVRSGIGKAGEPMVLPKALVEVAEAPNSMGDINFAGLADKMRAEVLAVLGASDGLVGLTTAYNRANIDGMERIVALGTVDPLNQFIVDAYNAWLLPLYPGQSEKSKLMLRIPSAARVDPMTLVERLRAEVEGGLSTANEARAEMGKPRHEDGDKLGSGGGGFGGGFPMIGPPMRRRASGKRTRALPADHPLSSHSARAAKWRELNAGRQNAEADLRKRYSTVMRAWRDELVQHIRDTGPVALERRALGEDDKSRALDVAAWAAALATSYKEWAKSWAMWRSYSAVPAGAPWSAALNDVTAAITPQLDARSTFAARQVVDTRWAQLQAQMEGLAGDGLTADQLADAIDESFPTASSGQARSFGATETTVIAGLVTLGMARALSQAMEVERLNAEGGEIQQAGDGGSAWNGEVGLMWLSQRDNIVRETHADADGQVVHLGEPFAVGGYELRYPGDGATCDDLGELINCRCEAVIVPLDASDS